MGVRSIKGLGLTLMMLGLFVGSAGPVCAPEAVDLGTLGGDESLAANINQARVIVGGAETADGKWHAFMWQDGVMTDLGTLGGDTSEAHDLTESPDLCIVGTSLAVIPEMDTPEDTFQRAFIWRAGVMSDLGPDNPYANSEAWAINESLQVVGAAGCSSAYQAVLWDQGVMTCLGTLGGTNSIAYDINADGLVVGSSDAPAPIEDPNQPTLPDVTRAFLWQAGAMTDLGTLGGRNSVAYAIDDQGSVSGWADTADGERHAFAWTEETGMQDLGTLGGTVAEAWGGRGLGTCGYSLDPNGNVTGYWLGLTYGLVPLENPLGGDGPTFVHAIGANARTVGATWTPEGNMRAFLRHWTMMWEVLP